ncbi:MAG: hypothetical protein AAFR81_30300, partial [Chloroflexota bacterium]
LSGEELKTLYGHSLAVTGVSFSPVRLATPQGLDYILASASADGTVKLWSVSGEELQTLPSERNANEGHSDSVNGVSFSPDGQTLASASWDGTVKLWSVSGEELTTLDGHSREVYGVSFSPDGQTLASASWDGTVKLWNFDLDDLMERGCNWLHDYLVNNPTVNDGERGLCPRAEADYQARLQSRGD